MNVMPLHDTFGCHSIFFPPFVLRCCSSQFPVIDTKHEKTRQTNEPPLCSPKQLGSVQNDGLSCPKQLSKKTSSRCMKIYMYTLTFPYQFARDKGLIGGLIVTCHSVFLVAYKVSRLRFWTKQLAAVKHPIHYRLKTCVNKSIYR